MQLVESSRPALYQTMTDYWNFLRGRWSGNTQYIAGITAGTIEAYLGYTGLGRVPAYKTTVNLGSSNTVNISHYLGYNPIVALAGNMGNLQLTYKYIDVNTMQVNNYSSGGNGWAGTVYCY